MTLVRYRPCNKWNIELIRTASAATAHQSVLTTLSSETERERKVRIKNLPLGVI